MSSVDNQTERWRQVAQLHVNNLDQGFLATLGVDTLALMYRAIDEEPQCHLLTEERDGKVVGFVTGGASLRPVYGRMLARWYALLLALAPKLFSPAVVWRILEIVFRGRGEPKGLPAQELLSIAVDPSYRGTGIAEALYERLRQCFAREGAESFKIVVGGELARAHAFYLSRGAVAVATAKIHGNAESVIYVDKTNT